MDDPAHKPGYDAGSCLTDSGRDNGDELPYNYWCGKADKAAYFTLDLGCSATIREIRLRNAYNSHTPGNEEPLQVNRYDIFTFL